MNESFTFYVKADSADELDHAALSPAKEYWQGREYKILEKKVIFNPEQGSDEGHKYMGTFFTMLKTKDA